MAEIPRALNWLTNQPITIWEYEIAINSFSKKIAKILCCASPSQYEALGFSLLQSRIGLFQTELADLLASITEAELEQQRLEDQIALQIALKASLSLSRTSSGSVGNAILDLKAKEFDAVIAKLRGEITQAEQDRIIFELRSFEAELQIAASISNQTSQKAASATIVTNQQEAVAQIDKILNVTQTTQKEIPVPEISVLQDLQETTVVETLPLTQEETPVPEPSVSEKSILEQLQEGKADLFDLTIFPEAFADTGKESTEKTDSFDFNFDNRIFYAVIALAIVLGFAAVGFVIKGGSSVG